MNKIICDICGSEYVQTEDRCPVCSYPRQGTEAVAAASAAAVAERVKGGRFSAKNVKKRQKERISDGRDEKEQDPNRPLLIVIALLLAAIVLVSAYICLRFFYGRNAYLPQQPSETTTAPVETTRQPVETTLQPVEIACKGIVLAESVLELKQVGDQTQLVLNLLPEDSTDVPVYTTSDPAVAVVSETGLVTIKGNGTATITIICGEAVKECTVICLAEEQTVPPSKTTAPTETTQNQASAELWLDQSDVSLFTMGESFTIRVHLGDTALSRSQVKWSSSDPGIATVENGVVTGVSRGTVTITAEYGGQKASCIVRCQIKDTSWTASSTDVTLAVGEEFQLTARNNSGKTADVIWTMSAEGIVTISGSTVKAWAEGTVTLTAAVDGVTVQCIVRVK